MELSTTLHKYLDDQTVQDTWNNIQENVSLTVATPTVDHASLSHPDGMLWSI